MMNTVIFRSTLPSLRAAVSRRQQASLQHYGSCVATANGKTSVGADTCTPRSARSQCARRHLHLERKIEELGITLPSAPTPKANYNIACVPLGNDNMMYISGQLPIKPDGTLITGALGPDQGGLTIDEGYEAARHCGLNIIALLKDQLGDLDRVEQVIKLFGMVSSHTDFKHQHLVMNGCSDVIMEVFDKPVGYHSRSAIGVNTLPLDATVEVEGIIKFKTV